MKKQRTLVVAGPKLLHYLLRSDGDKTVAHCLDYDLVAVAPEQAEAMRRLNLVVRAHMEASRQKRLMAPLQHRAPDRYWSEFHPHAVTAILP